MRRDETVLVLIKMFFSIFMPTLLELEVYRFVCDFILFMMRPSELDR